MVLSGEVGRLAIGTSSKSRGLQMGGQSTLGSHYVSVGPIVGGEGRKF